MLNTYIKNVGSAQTIIGNRCNNHVEELDWKADYDGDKAKVLLRTNTDGHKKKYNLTLDNADLANLLNVDSVNMPIHKRLKSDFSLKKSNFSDEPKVYRIELPSRQSSSLLDDDSLSEIMSSPPDSYLPSPASNDQFIVPVTLNPGPYQKYTFTPKRRNLTLRTHKTHRVFKRPKRYRSRRRSRSSSSRRSSRSISSRRSSR